jgi:hypothetical protein
MSVHFWPSVEGRGRKFKRGRLPIGESVEVAQLHMKWRASQYAPTRNWARPLPRQII